MTNRQANHINKTKKIAIIGAGALGCYYGARLQQQGHEIHYHSRTGAGANVKLMRIKSIRGNFSVKPTFHGSPATIPPSDLIIVALKALPHIDYKALITPVLKSNSEIILLQNGINTEEHLAEIFPHNVIFGAIAFTCIHRVKPDLIEHTDYGLIKIGPLNSRDQKKAIAIASIFNEAGIETQAVKKLRQTRWEKLLWNIAYNPLSVILGDVTTDMIMSHPFTRKLAQELMQEVRAIATKDGCRITKQDIAAMLEKTEKMEPYKTSMLVDYLAGKPLEVEALLEEPLKIAAKLKVEAPQIRTLLYILQFYAARRP